MIRKTNPERTVVIGPVQWNSIQKLDSLSLPSDDRNIIATVHYYNPFAFTHQGASWTDRKDKLGVLWKATPEEQAAVRKDLDKAKAWSQKENRPIYLGEFGAYDKAEMPSRARYVGFVARAAEPAAGAGPTGSSIVISFFTTSALNVGLNRYGTRWFLTLVIMAPDQVHGDPDTARMMDQIVREHGQSGRTFKGALIFVVPEAGDALREEAR